MSSQARRREPLTEASQQFQEELDLVRSEMIQAVSGLGSPLRELVLRRIEDAAPPYRAALVLAAGYNSTDTETMQRIRLGAALEMLHVSLGIHQLLLGASMPASAVDGPDLAEDRSFIGSTILAGDFCFSLAAQMAAATRSPAAVAVFAQALQDASEERLRALHPTPQSAPLAGQASDERVRDETLLRAGATAALEFSDVPASLLPTVRKLSAAITAETCRSWSPSAAWEDASDKLPPGHALRWQALSEWLTAHSQA